MSRFKRARPKPQARTAVPAPAEVSEAEASRFAPARRRARAAKLVISATAAVSALSAMGLARATYAGHAKHPVRTLSIPQPLYRVVRQNLLQAGILAPATAPPDVATSTS